MGLPIHTVAHACGCSPGLYFLKSRVDNALWTRFLTCTADVEISECCASMQVKPSRIQFLYRTVNGARLSGADRNVGWMLLACKLSIIGFEGNKMDTNIGPNTTT